ncbi:MAG: hypothetical protein HZT40_15665 [Candidatus Thiothrix singaporensis]|uniref:Uncharacterized protein n=1 Tax=Candidatus Thiothrix singaporensis TaxID=2799669 RepID=A0A7L6AUN5_9GAMM|nr:MAG: hypothetical protein HZT40_15665 [Candidatus Thiothrix singaporensis]
MVEKLCQPIFDSGMVTLLVQLVQANGFDESAYSVTGLLLLPAPLPAASTFKSKYTRLPVRPDRQDYGSGWFPR